MRRLVLILGLLSSGAVMAEQPAAAPAESASQATAEAAPAQNPEGPESVAAAAVSEATAAEAAAVAATPGETTAGPTSAAAAPVPAVPAPVAEPVVAPAPPAPALVAAEVPASQPVVAEPAAVPGIDPGAPAKVDKAQTAAAANLLGPQDGLQVTASWGLNAGIQTDADNTSAQTSMAIGANYKLAKKVFLAGSISPYVELTKMPGDNRRTQFDGPSSFLRLNFRNLYKDDLTGISVGGNVTYFLPITYNDLFTGNPRFGAISSALQLFRGIGPVTLIGSAGFNVPFFRYASAHPDCNDEENGPDVGCPTSLGGQNTKYSLSTGLTAFYSEGPWSVVSAFSLAGRTSYGASEARNPGAVGRDANESKSFSFFAQLGYALGEHFTINGGFSNAGPQIDDKDGYNNFIFDKTLAAVFVGVDWVR